MKKIVPLICIVLSCGVSFSFSQESQGYKNAVGLRGGWVGGITGKHFLDDDRAIEGILSSGWGWRGFQLTGLYEIHKEAFTKEDAENFFWYYGAGAHIGDYVYKRWHPTGFTTGYYDRYPYATIGIDGIFGLEYRIQDLPVTLSLDVKPFIEIPTFHKYAIPYHFWDSAFTIRYVFKNSSK